MFNFDEKTLVVSVSAFVVLALLSVLILSIKVKTRAYSAEPDITEIRHICELATMELDYNDVASANKTYWLFGKKTKKLWIKHKAAVKVGIDVSKIEVSKEGGKWIITLPKAEVLEVKCDPDSFTRDSFLISKSFFTKITAEEQNEAMHRAQENLRKDVEKQSEFLFDSQSKAKKILENYFLQLNEKTGSDIQVSFKLL